MKFSKGKFKLHLKDGVEVEGMLSPYLRFCIGTGILLITICPFIYSVVYALKYLS